MFSWSSHTYNVPVLRMFIHVPSIINVNIWKFVKFMSHKDQIFKFAGRVLHWDHFVEVAQRKTSITQCILYYHPWKNISALFLLSKIDYCRRTQPVSKVWARTMVFSMCFPRTDQSFNMFDAILSLQSISLNFEKLHKCL